LAARAAGSTPWQNCQHIPACGGSPAAAGRRDREVTGLTATSSSARISAVFEKMRHAVLDMAIHTFDVGRLFADGAPQTVWCREWNPKNSWYAHDGSAIAVFEMGDGVVFNYRGSWCAEGLRTSWESAWRITGTLGTLLWDGEEDIRAEVATKRGPGLFSACEAVTVPPLDARDRVGGHRGIIEDFVQAIRTGQPPETAGAENIKSLAMVFGAIESAETGRGIHINGVN
jgi:predicted dehydrogenase